MQRENPNGLWGLVYRSSETMRLRDRDKSERVREGEMGFGVGVEDSDAETVLGIWRQDHRKLIVEDAHGPGGAARPATLREGRDPQAMRRQHLIECRRALL